MFYKIKNFIFFYKRPAVFLRDFSEIFDSHSLASFNDGYSFEKIDKLDLRIIEDIKGLFENLEYKKPFTIKDADERLNDGQIFFVIKHNGHIVGWRWYAFQEVYCSEFSCKIKIKKKQCYAYNLFVDKNYRGNDLAAILIVNAERYLKKIGVEFVWSINYDWNVASQKTVINSGAKKIGYYSVINVLGFKYHSMPIQIKVLP